MEVELLSVDNDCVSGIVATLQKKEEEERKTSVSL